MLFLPPKCLVDRCALLLLPGGCDAFHDGTPGGSDGDFAKYGADAYSVTNLGACGSTMLKHSNSPYWQRSQFTAALLVHHGRHAS